MGVIWTRSQLQEGHSQHPQPKESERPAGERRSPRSDIGSGWGNRCARVAAWGLVRNNQSALAFCMRKTTQLASFLHSGRMCGGVLLPERRPVSAPSPASRLPTRGGRRTPLPHLGRSRQWQVPSTMLSLLQMQLSITSFLDIIPRNY
ncbi:uncharacterized protein LOC101179220 [Nomascus leucogenys]|uniref:uncharacterized protein LOC101179220 n=1 Tax=Nomascus leucogenys TaxID=61853 RepID=UPI00122D9557|nr:uncharacterized protein LOC101179220 [Nomascus leucogenys]